MTNVPADYQPPSESQTSMFRPLGAIGLSLLLYIVPQGVLILLVGLLAASIPVINSAIQDPSVGTNFLLYGGFEVLSLIGLALIMKSMRLKLGDLGVKKAGLRQAWMVIPAFVFYFILTTFILTIASIFVSEETLSQEQELGFEAANQFWELGVAFAALVVIAPVVEELLFRGFLFKLLRRDWNFIASALVSAGLFGLAHLQLNVGLDTFALALPLAFLVEKTDNTIVAMLLHAAKNLVAFLFLFVIDLDALAALF